MTRPLDLFSNEVAILFHYYSITDCDFNGANFSKAAVQQALYNLLYAQLLLDNTTHHPAGNIVLFKLHDVGVRAIDAALAEITDRTTRVAEIKDLEVLLHYYKNPLFDIDKGDFSFTARSIRRLQQIGFLKTSTMVSDTLAIFRITPEGQNTVRRFLDALITASSECASEIASA